MMQLTGMLLGGHVMVVVGVAPGSNVLIALAQMCKSCAASTGGKQGTVTVLPVKLQSATFVAVVFRVLVLSTIVALVMTMGDGANPAAQYPRLACMAAARPDAWIATSDRTLAEPVLA